MTSKETSIISLKQINKTKHKKIRGRFMQNLYKTLCQSRYKMNSQKHDMFYILSQVFAELFITCDLPKDYEFVITLFHVNDCAPCDNVMPILEEIDSRLERNNKKVAIRYTNCSTCECAAERNEIFPIIKIHQNDIELAKIADYLSFTEISNKIVETTGFDKHMFVKRIKTNPGHVVKLNERDFYSGFDGPWIILFYNKTSDSKRELIYRVAPDYKSKLNVGEINGNHSDVLLDRFGITFLPTVIALYDGLIVSYSGKDNINEFREFIDELIRPSFPNITLDEFNKLKKMTHPSDPIFIVFYSDLGVVNENFRSIAHEYKFRANIYKSNDPGLIELAKVNLNEDVFVVTVFKHSMFHVATREIAQSNKIFEWIWHSHYPSVTRVNNDNFYAIMHGLKPAMILISKNEELVPEFELASEFLHRGEPYAEQIFASVDVESYPLFVPKLIPKISIPSIVIHNPVDQKFYVRKVKLTKQNLREAVETMIELYNTGKLLVYPYKTNYYKYALFMLGLLGAIYLLNSKIKQKKYTIIENFPS